jgi:hypothetical protein
MCCTLRQHSSVLRGLLLRYALWLFLSCADVYCDRRLPADARTHEVLLGECLGGALAINDFVRLCQQVGALVAHPFYAMLGCDALCCAVSATHTQGLVLRCCPYVQPCWDELYAIFIPTHCKPVVALNPVTS